MPKYKEFKPVSGKQNPIFELGMIFKSRAQFVGVVRHHAILNGKDIRFKMNDGCRVRAICRQGCPWTIFASLRRGHNKILQVKIYEPKHICGRILVNRLVNSSWLVMVYLNEFRLNPTSSVSSLIERIRVDFNVMVSQSQVYRARKKALRKLAGSVSEQYAKLWNYCQEIERTNPGSTVYLHFKPDSDGNPTNVFQRFNVCWAALRKGFIEGCRRIIGVDGCHLKSALGGQLDSCSLQLVWMEITNCILWHMQW